MNDMPDVDEALRCLQALLRVGSPLTPSTRIADADLDSLAVVEWMLDLGIDPESVFAADNPNDGLLENDAATLGELYALFVKAKVES